MTALRARGLLALALATSASAALAGCVGEDLVYVGILAKTTFGEAWDPAASRAALEADGFNVTAAGARGLATAARGDLSVAVDASRAPWTFAVSYRAEETPANGAQEVQKLASADWTGFQPRFHDVVNDFEARVGFKHIQGASWEAVSTKG